MRELLPQLRTGKITRGRIGVDGRRRSRARRVDEFGLKDRKGAVVATVVARRRRGQGRLEPGDVIIELNGKPVKNRDELVQMVVNTRPGTTRSGALMRDKQEKTISVTVDELDLEAEANRVAQRSRAVTITAQRNQQRLRHHAAEHHARDRAPAAARESDAARSSPTSSQGSPAARAGLQPGDVIVRVGRQPVPRPADASASWPKVPSGGTAFLRVLRDGQETFVSVTKE